MGTLNFMIVELGSYCTFAQDFNYLQKWKGILEFLN